LYSAYKFNRVTKRLIYLKDSSSFRLTVINKGYIAHFSLRIRETAVFPLPV